MAIETYFKDIADAIRAKAGTSGLITPAQMPAAIADIPSGIEGIIFGETAPDNSEGENGDYYYQRNNIITVIDINTITATSSQQGAGFEFTVPVTTVIKGFYSRVRYESEGYYQIGDLQQVIAQTNSVSLSASDVNTIQLSTPITLQPNVHYIVKLITTRSSNLYYKYVSSSEFKGLTYLNGRYSTNYPGTYENDVVYSVLPILEGPYEYIHAQYIKISNIWTQL